MKTPHLTKHYPFAIGIPAVIWQVIFFYIPLALLVAGSFFIWSEERGFVGFSLEKFLFFLRPPYLTVIGASLLLALSNAVLCFLIAYPLAYFMAFRGKKWRN